MNNISSSPSWGTTVLRVIVGVIFLVHGSQKLFSFGFSGVTAFFTHAGIPLPAVSAPVVTLVEFLGGLALILGGALALQPSCWLATCLAPFFLFISRMDSSCQQATSSR